MPDRLGNDGNERRTTKKIALILAAVAFILLVIAAVWWSNLADADVEEGPVGPAEAITDSADD